MTPEEMNMVLIVVSGLLTMWLGYLAVKYVKFRKSIDFAKKLILYLVDDLELTNEELIDLVEDGKEMFGKDE